jgi:hypothetical protein
MPRSPEVIASDIETCPHPDTRDDRLRATFISGGGAVVNAHTCLRCGAVAIHEVLSKDDPARPQWQTPDLVAEMVQAIRALAKIVRAISEPEPEQEEPRPDDVCLNRHHGGEVCGATRAACIQPQGIKHLCWGGRPHAFHRRQAFTPEPETRK